MHFFGRNHYSSALQGEGPRIEAVENSLYNLVPGCPACTRCEGRPRKQPKCLFQYGGFFFYNEDGNVAIITDWYRTMKTVD